MRAVTVTGVLPAFLAENSRLGDWVGTLTLAGDLSGLSRVEAIGSHGLYFATSWDPLLGLVFVTPGAVADFEAFRGASPVLGFSLRLDYADGSVLDLPTQYQVTVLDRDDTAPTALRFATGGAVTAGAIGATIGSLAVTDPDSAGPFYFTFSEEDAWRFEVVGNTLKLRDGISLGLDDAPSRPLFIQVSDGHQSAAFTLDLIVRTPADQQSVVPLQLPGETRAGITLDGTGSVARSMLEAREVTTDNAYGGGLRQLRTGHGGTWLSGVEQVKLADGIMDYAADSLVARAAALQAALLDSPASGTTLAQHSAQAAQGTAWVELAQAMLPAGSAALSDAGYIGRLFLDLLDRAPSAAELALHEGRLASGVSRAQLAVDLALAPEALAAQADQAGHWVFQPAGGGTAWRSDPGGIGHAVAGAPASATEGVWLL